MELLLAVDMGTTHIKVATFSLDGSVRTQELVRNEAVSIGSGSAIYEPDALWEKVAALLRKTTSQLAPDDKILSISVASMGEAGLFLGRDGKPITPIMTWFDIRGKETMEEWYQQISPEECFQITGLSYNYIYSAFKILWIKKHQRELFEQGQKWLCVPDYVYYCLTGEHASDYSIASRTMFFDIRTKDWSDKLLDLAGLSREMLPALHQSGTIIGTVTAQAAAETGLAEGIPVAVGGHDHICGAFAAGVLGPGKVLDSMGTAESLVAVFSMTSDMDISTLAGLNVGCHVVPGCHYIHGGVDSSGVSFEWFREQFEDQGGYDRLIAQAKTSPPGAQGMFFVPHLRGGSPPVRDPYSKACFAGVRDYHTKADFIRSIHEGLAFEVSHILRTMEDVLGVEFSEIYGIGGGTKNPLWMEIKSHVSGKPIIIPEVQEATLLGAALLGGVGAGVFASYGEAAAAASKVRQRYLPDAALHEQYQGFYRTYTEITPLVRKIGNIIGEF